MYHQYFDWEIMGWGVGGRHADLYSQGVWLSNES